jgi:hypothetical protein
MSIPLSFRTAYAALEFTQLVVRHDLAGYTYGITMCLNDILHLRSVASPQRDDRWDAGVMTGFQDVRISLA